MGLTETYIAGRRCLVGLNGDAPTVLSAASSPAEETAEELVAKLAGIRECPPFGLLLYEVGDWNAELSPWPGRTRIGTFGGKAEETLLWLGQSALPFIRASSRGPVILAGYSLAGLFSLWCMSRGNLADGIVSCSGSLWYPDWDAYMRTAKAQRPCVVYLSLGDREARTRDPDMSRVEERTKEQALRLNGDRNVTESILVSESGGHFQDCSGRLARGIAWALGKLTK